MRALMVAPQEPRTLIEAAKAGDRAAFEQLLSLQANRIRALVADRLRARIALDVDADDVYQEALLRAYKSLAGFEWRGDDSFLRWIGGIAENVIFELARTRTRERKTALDGQVPAADVSPSRTVRREERLDRLEASLDKLRPEQRKAIMLVRIEGLTFEEAAKQMQRSPDAVKQLLYRALKDLKETFGDTESFHLPGRALKRPENETNG